MFTKTKIIVLKAVKYQEKSLIVNCYTQAHGVQSFFIPTAFSSKKKQHKIAYFQPLTLLDVEYNFKNKGTLEHFKEIKIAEPYTSIHNNIFKNTVALFFSEALNNCLQESESDPELYNFLEAALLWLDHHNEIANFHIMALLKLTKFLGFTPDKSSSGIYFDILNGNFSFTKNANTISEEESLLFQKALQLDFSDDQKIFLGQERQQILKVILDYYQIHIEKFRQPQSLEIFKEIFN